jgi:hypothetical protein
MQTNIVRFLGLIGLGLILACAAHADTAQMVFTGPNSAGINDGTYYVSPYSGTMNGVTVTLFCDDVLHEVYSGEKWTANVTNLGTAISTLNGFANTRFGSGISAANATILYEEVAWLVTQFTPTDQNQWVNIQHALWDLTDPGAYGGSATLSWLDSAEMASNYGSINPNNFLIVSDVNLTGSGSVQEFIVETTSTPEPSSLVLLVSGMLAMMLIVIRRGRI